MQNLKIYKLLQVMKTLRDPIRGCPWDKKQTMESIIPYSIEEIYEVAEQVYAKNYPNLKDELGDLLFQVVFHCEMAKEMNLFDFDDVVNAISEKLISRHPHVFGGATIDDVKIQTDLWERQKIQEMQKSGKKLSVLDGIGKNQPALNRALKLGKRASSVGFDWQSTEDVMIKISEELEELTSALKSDEAALIEEELGDLLFSIVNLARNTQKNPETALRKANQKFEARFRGMEDHLQTSNQKLENLSFQEMDKLWELVKRKHDVS